MGLRAASARPQRVSGSARIHSRRAESARNPIASHVNFGDDSALTAFTRTQWTAAFRRLFLFVLCLCLVPSAIHYNYIVIFVFEPLSTATASTYIWLTSEQGSVKNKREFGMLV